MVLLLLAAVIALLVVVLALVVLLVHAGHRARVRRNARRRARAGGYLESGCFLGDEVGR